MSAAAQMEAELTRTLQACGVIPVVVLEDVSVAVDLAHALQRGGLATIELTLRTPDAEQAIRNLAAVPDLLVGAGTVTTVDQVDLAVAAGARFLVTPGWSDQVVERSRQHGMPIYPGIATATELQHALESGLRAVKVFPASALGGPATLRAYASTYPDMRFIPTGGISEAELVDYLAVPSVLAVGGSWLTPADALASHDWAAITAAASRAAAVAGARDLKDAR